MDIRLISFDLDGTFLDENKNIPPRNLDAIKEANRRGIHIVPASGRTYAGMPPALKELDFIRYFITANGSCVYDAWEDKVIYNAFIPLELALRFLEYADTLPVLYDCYKESFGYTSEAMWLQYEDYIKDPGMLRHVKSMRKPVDDLKSHMRQTQDEGILKLQMFFKDMDARQRQLELMPRLFPELLFSSSLPGNVEINIADGSKGQALCRLCEMLGFDASNAMALGDGSNDRDMIAAAGMGVAMANAEPGLLAIANYVTGHCNDAGLAQAIERFAL